MERTDVYAGEPAARKRWKNCLYTILKNKGVTVTNEK